MNQLFKKQLEKAVPITEERLNMLQKTYTSGKEIKVGDIILYAYGVSEPYCKDDGVPIIDVKVLSLSPDEIENYNYRLETINELIPTILK